MITILIGAILFMCVLCSVAMLCSFIVGGRADERAPSPQPLVPESWEDARADYEEQHGVTLQKFFR
jgi:hypothetical protein